MSCVIEAAADTYCNIIITYIYLVRALSHAASTYCYNIVF